MNLINHLILLSFKLEIFFFNKHSFILYLFDKKLNFEA